MGTGIPDSLSGIFLASRFLLLAELSGQVYSEAVRER